MTVSWSGGADIAQTLVPTGLATPFEFPILTVPALTVVPGGTLALSLSMRVFDPVGVPKFANLSGVPFAATLIGRNSLGTQLFASDLPLFFDSTDPFAEPVILKNLFDTDGGSLSLAGTVSTDTQYVYGVVVALIDTVPAPALLRDFELFDAGTTSKTNTITIGTTGTPQAVYGLAAVETLDTVSPSFATDPAWADDVRRQFQIPFCAIDGAPDLSLSANPFLRTVFASLPANPSFVKGSVFVLPSGIGSASSANVGVQYLDAGGSVVFSNFTMPSFPATGAGANFSNDIGGFGVAGIRFTVASVDVFPNIMQLSYQVVVWCNGTEGQSYTAAIGHLTGTLVPASVPFTITYGVPTISVSFFQGSLFQIYSFESLPGRAFAQMIG